jgi:hypothetical protein
MDLVAGGDEVRYWNDIVLGLTGLKNLGKCVDVFSLLGTQLTWQYVLHELDYTVLECYISFFSLFLR